GGTGASITAGALPSGVTGSYNAGVFTIAGTPTMSGLFTYTVTTSGPCINASLNGSITISPASIGGTLSTTQAVLCVGANTGTITLTGYTGSIISWEQSLTAGNTWTTIANTTTSLSYTNLTQTTLYRAVVQNGVGICSIAYSTTAQMIVNPAFTPIITASSLATCVGQPVTLTASGYTSSGLVVSAGDFGTNQPAGWTGFNGNSSNNSGGNPSNNVWGQTNGTSYNGVQYNSTPSNDKFFIVSGNVNSILTTPAFSTVGLSAAILTLNQAYNLNAGATAKIEISLDGGSTYTTLQNYTGNLGPTNGLSATMGINLNAYLGMTNLMIRFNYLGNVGSDWALDNVTITNSISNPSGVNVYQPLTYVWSPSTALSTTTGSSVTFTPTGSGSFPYIIATSAGGCTATTTSVTINVNALPTITASASATSVCAATGAQSTTLAYSATTGAPNTYSITWGASPANSFVAVTDATLTAGSITIAVPLNTLPGTYTGTLRVKNANGCVSSTGVPFSVIINPRPSAVLSGTQSICNGSTAILSLVLTGSGTISGTLSNAQAFSGTASTITVSVNPVITTPYTIATLTNGTCASIAADISGSVLVTVNNPVVVTPVAGTSFCFGSNGSVAVTSSGISPTYQWQESTAGSAGPWTNLNATAPYTGVTSGTLNITSPAIALSTSYYRVVVSGSFPCAAVTSTPVALKFKNVWMGTADNNWNNAGNWSDGLLPSANSCPDVYIPNRTNQLTLSSAPVPVITNLVIASNATLTVTNASIKIGGTISNSGTFDVTNGTLDFNGTSAQNIAGSYFKNNTLKNLTISSSNQLNIIKALTLDSLNVSGTIAFGSGNNSINSNGNLVLVSDAAGTAIVADITNNGIVSGNTVNGVVTVQRFFPSRRAWRLFTAPVSGGGSVFDNWQNGGIYMPGKGTMVSGLNASVSNGLDYTPLNNSSLKVTSALTAIANTYNAKLSIPSATSAANIPYFIFVRGDRDPINYNFPYSNNTTLSSKGVLQTGTQTFPVSTVDRSFTLVGNPYTSPVAMNKLGLNNLTRRFYVWDPYINVDQGAYVYFEDVLNDGNYTAIPNGTTLTNVLQSGQAFYVETASAGVASVVFDETAKSSSTNPVAFRPLGRQPASIRANLYHLNAGNNVVLLDGVMAQFDDSFSAGIDILDAYKAGNVKEMLALLRNSTALTVERRPLVVAEDTLYFKLTKTTQRSYRFVFVPTNLDPTLSAFLEDSYTGKKSPLSVIANTEFDFIVTGDANSAAANRFRIVFKPGSGPLPVTYKTVKAYQQAVNIAVEWTVENEINLSRYEVERSADGTNFAKVNTTPATGSNSTSTKYSWLDTNPISGNNFYRIRNVDKDGSFEYSNIVLVKMGNAASGIRIYPNPVEDGIIGAEFKNMAAGVYNTRLINSAGQTIFSKTVSHAPGTSMEYIQPGYKIASGTYQLEVTTPGKEIVVVNVIVK
ncbi:MAG: type sorting protein, partial [Ferruginibacter sp.]|nr:type sorting protein [Ferruginibacter sp.]